MYIVDYKGSKKELPFELTDKKIHSVRLLVLSGDEVLQVHSFATDDECGLHYDEYDSCDEPRCMNYTDADIMLKEDGELTQSEEFYEEFNKRSRAVTYNKFYEKDEEKAKRLKEMGL